jgi:hypothetical protein
MLAISRLIELECAKQGLTLKGPSSLPDLDRAVLFLCDGKVSTIRSLLIIGLFSLIE